MQVDYMSAEARKCAGLEVDEDKDEEME